MRGRLLASSETIHATIYSSAFTKAGNLYILRDKFAQGTDVYRKYDNLPLEMLARVFNARNCALRATFKRDHAKSD